MSNHFQAFMGPSAPLLLKGVRNFATPLIPQIIPRKPIYVKNQNFLVCIFVAQLLIYFNRADQMRNLIPMLLIATIDPILRSHLQQTLAEKGEPFLLLEEGENIVDLAFRHYPSVVIVDLYLSHPSGIEILRQLRTEGYSGKVVVLGGQSAQTLAPEATRLGALQIVGRPFNASQVLGAVRVANGTLDDDPE